MSKERNRKEKARICDKIDIELASDADLNSLWENETGGRSPSPREKITIGQAIVGGITREQEADETPSQSKN